MDIPNWIREKMPPQVRIVWWGRRAVYEVIEEISYSFFWSYIAVSFLFNFGYSLDLFASPLLWSATVMLLGFTCNTAFFEMLRWYNEVYVVVKNNNTRNGRIYKFSAKYSVWDWGTRKEIEDAITDTSPSVSGEQTLMQRVWARLTGEEMMKVTLSSVNNTFITGSRISPALKKAINSVRGHAPGASSENVVFEGVYEVMDVSNAGLITRREASEVVRSIIRRRTNAI